MMWFGVGLIRLHVHTPRTTGTDAATPESARSAEAYGDDDPRGCRFADHPWE